MLGGTTQRTSAAGVASFTNLTFNVAGNYTLTASATGFTAATSAAFTIAPAVNQLSVVVPPASTRLNTPVTLQAWRSKTTSISPWRCNR